jgi:CrcB protein
VAPTVIALLGVAFGGVVGAPLRYALDRWITSRIGGAFPWGTFLINATGALLLGLVSGLALYDGLGHLPVTVVGTGFCGAYTTFSTFSYETVRLIEEDRVGAAMRNAAGSLAVGILAAAGGIALATVV